mgnify:CR=1 FL=1
MMNLCALIATEDTQKNLEISYVCMFLNSLKVRVFDLNSDDPLILSNIVGEAVVSCWSMANILPTDTKGMAFLSNH